MGYEYRTFGLSVSLDAHGGEAERRDSAQWCQMAGRLLAVIKEYSNLGTGPMVADYDGPFMDQGPDACVWCGAPFTDHHPDYPPITNLQTLPPPRPRAEDLPEVAPDLSATLFQLHNDIFNEASSASADPAYRAGLQWAAARTLELIDAVRHSRKRNAYPTRPGTTVRLTNDASLYTLHGRAELDGAFVTIYLDDQIVTIPAARIRDITMVEPEVDNEVEGSVGLLIAELLEQADRPGSHRKPVRLGNAYWTGRSTWKDGALVVGVTEQNPVADHG